jgi:hypothetical protein
LFFDIHLVCRHDRIPSACRHALGLER